MGSAFRQMLHNVSCHNWRGKENANAGILVPGTIEASCANTSATAQPALSYTEKKSTSSQFNTDRRIDGVYAMRSTLHGSFSSQTALNVAHAIRMMTSRVGREVAPAMSFLAVGIHYNYYVKAVLTCNLNNCTSNT